MYMYVCVYIYIYVNTYIYIYIIHDDVTRCCEAAEWRPWAAGLRLKLKTERPKKFIEAFLAGGFRSEGVDK